jgi:hypothetical protein
VEKVKNQRVVSLAGLPKCPFSHLFSMPSLIAQVEGYFGKHFTLIFSHIGVGITTTLSVMVSWSQCVLTRQSNEQCETNAVSKTFIKQTRSGL